MACWVVAAAGAASAIGTRSGVVMATGIARSLFASLASKTAVVDVGPEDEVIAARGQVGHREGLRLHVARAGGEGRSLPPAQQGRARTAGRRGREMERVGPGAHRRPRARVLHRPRHGDALSRHRRCRRRQRRRHEVGRRDRERNGQAAIVVVLLVERARGIGPDDEVVAARRQGRHGDRPWSADSSHSGRERSATAMSPAASRPRSTWGSARCTRCPARTRASAPSLVRHRPGCRDDLLGRRHHRRAGSAERRGHEVRRSDLDPSGDRIVLVDLRLGVRDVEPHDDVVVPAGRSGTVTVCVWVYRSPSLSPPAWDQLPRKMAPAQHVGLAEMYRLSCQRSAVASSGKGDTKL